MSAYEQVRERTEALEAAFYALLAACDAYRSTVDGLRFTEEASQEPNPQLVHRLAQLSGWVGDITRIVEDDALTKLLPVLDRLFAVERAEAGVDI
ncbi:MAG: hypothetical protein ACRD29_13175 [Acidimicrobiales bacterium]